MIRETMKRVVAAIGIIALAASASNAQQASASPKWRGWIGCWAPAASTDAVFETPTSRMIVCITPTSNPEVVTFTTIENGKTVMQQPLDASGREQPVTADKCDGTQRAKWSADERRIYLSSSGTCEGLRTSTSAILSITPSGDWLDVHSVTAGGNENVRVARYHDAGRPSALPAEIADALGDRGISSQSARIATGGSIGTTAVIEATRSVEPSVVQAWLLELGQGFNLNAESLRELARAGVPGRVTDAMIAVSYPGVFQVARAEPGGVTADEELFRTRRGVAIDRDPMMRGVMGYGTYGYVPYGYGYNPYTYLGGGGYYGGYYSPPIIIVNGSSQSQTRGQVVKGRGYTQSSGSSSQSGGRSASPSYSPPSSPSSGGSSAPSSSSSGSSSSGSSSTGRTAQPRH